MARLLALPGTRARAEVAPLVSAHYGLENLRLTEAIASGAHNSQVVQTDVA